MNRSKHMQARTRRQRGAALAEYGLLVAGVTLASLVAVSVLGGKVGGLVASVATLLPARLPRTTGSCRSAISSRRRRPPVVPAAP